ncbi:hypothetical protein EDD18DRAFT_1356087 [Armillaria luteobubalina]|uniref:Uncharacterized protein n=1 Tax=Armillaria luteobubalina TaxID=153913 RepID=A0AA39Q0Y9_9AGAR|nr:hypothetical protein EDD18DRAFT_1356087 [Armillaria luteobubalina]
MPPSITLKLSRGFPPGRVFDSMVSSRCLAPRRSIVVRKGLRTLKFRVTCVGSHSLIFTALYRHPATRTIQALRDHHGSASGETQDWELRDVVFPYEIAHFLRKIVPSTWVVATMAAKTDLHSPIQRDHHQRILLSIPRFVLLLACQIAEYGALMTVRKPRRAHFDTPSPLPTRLPSHLKPKQTIPVTVESLFPLPLYVVASSAVLEDRLFS